MNDEMTGTGTAEFLQPEAVERAALAVLKELDGMPLSQAMYVLQDLAPALLQASVVVDVQSQRFKAVTASGELPHVEP